MTAIMTDLPEALQHVVAKHPWLTAVHYFDAIDSTNALAMAQVAKGAAANAALYIANHQTAGKGRFDNVWESAPGDDVLFSLVIEPTVDAAAWPRMSFPLGVAIRDALAGFVPQHMAVQLKWPNDILANQQKLVGMLLSSDVGANAIVAGIGVNVNHRSAVAERTSLAMLNHHPIQRWDVLDDVLTAIANHWSSICACEVPVNDWNQHAAHMNQSVEVTEHHCIEGIFRGINDAGAAMIETANGVRSIINGRNFRPLALPPSP